MSRASKKRWQSAQHKREPGQFIAFPKVCWEHRNYARLSPHAKALLLELLGQYTGNNNGDLCCAPGAIANRSLGCRQRIEKARDELEKSGWIVKTRIGGNNTPHLYALTFLDVDECGGKLDAHIRIGYRYSFWQMGENPLLPPGRSRKRGAA